VSKVLSEAEKRIRDTFESNWSPRGNSMASLTLSCKGKVLKREGK